MNLLFKNNRFYPAVKAILSGFKQGARAGDCILYEQTVIKDGNGAVPEVIAFTGANTHAGAETHTGLEIFSNALGLKSDMISERTAGAGTIIKTPVLAVTGATLTALTTPAISATTSGTTYTLSKVDGITVTLPACSATNVGLKYRFAIITSVTSVGYIINTTGADVFVGGVWGAIATPDAANDMKFGASTANKTITLSATTTGGLVGGYIDVVCVSATQWHVAGVTLGTGVIATPFSN
jgi:hypothetical protein